MFVTVTAFGQFIASTRNQQEIDAPLPMMGILNGAVSDWNYTVTIWLLRRGSLKSCKRKPLFQAGRH
jgi:hypothetical protein